MSDDKKVIFSMVKVNKTTPTGKHILKDIYFGQICRITPSWVGIILK